MEIRTGFLPIASRTLILVGLPNVGNLRVTQKIGVVRATVTLAVTYRTAGCGIGEDRLKYSYSTTNKMHPFLKLFILVKRCTCFGLSVHHQELKTAHKATGMCLAAAV